MGIVLHPVVVLLLPLSCAALSIRHDQLTFSDRRGVVESAVLWPPRSLRRSVSFIASGVRVALSEEARPSEPESSVTKIDKESDSSPNPFSSSWFPLAFESYMEKSLPTRHHLLGSPIVLWHHDSRWYAMLDICPHRLASLSEGRVLPDSGHIECPYHGFTFEGTTGKCTSVPQADPPDGSDLPGLETRGCGTSLPVQVQQGVIYVHAGPLFGEPPPDSVRNPESFHIKKYHIDAIGREGVLHVDYFRDLPMDFTTLTENVLDPAHLPFTHHKTISNRDNAGVLPVKITGPISIDGFSATKGSANTKSEGLDPAHPGTIEFRAPHLVYSATHRGQKSFSDYNVVYAVPTRPGRSRLLVRVVFEVAKMKPPLKWIFSVAFRQPSWLLHLNNHRILEDDNVFLHHQMHNWRNLNKRGVTFKDGTYLPTSADAAVIAYHKWLDRYASDGNVWSPHAALGALEGEQALERTELIERKSSHTDSCVSCSGARRWLDRIQPVLSAGALLCAIRGFGGATDVDSGFRWSWAVAAGALGLLRQKVMGVRGDMETGRWPPPRNE